MFVALSGLFTQFRVKAERYLGLFEWISQRRIGPFSRPLALGL